jgi:hypothetical protein
MSRFSTTGEFRRLREADHLDDTQPNPQLGDTQPNLQLEDTHGQVVRGVGPPASPASAHGANPYDTYPQVGKTGLHDRNAELRRLSAWIRQKRSAEELKILREKGEDDSG